MAGNSERVDLIIGLDRLLASSEHLQRLDALRILAESRQLATGAEMSANTALKAWRVLTKQELAQLEAQGNLSPDWQKIRVTPDFLADYIHGCYFGGTCLLGRFDGSAVELEKELYFPNGLYNSSILDAIIGDGALVYRAGLLANYLIETGAIIFETAALTAVARCTFGNGEELLIGSETGGREVPAFAELSQALANAVALDRRDKNFQQQYREFIAAYSTASSLPCGAVETGSIIRYSGKVTDTYVGAGSLLDKASLVHNCTLLSSSEEPVEISHDAQVSHSCLQWGCKISSQAWVERAVLLEHSHVERQGKVTMSIIGANTGVAEGEVTSSLVGPFVGFHHQALLIACLWPAGKGNVGYGANVGSNHTGKAPDQELLAGEGCFFGLGVNIKFPANFSKAPYSLFATGLDTLPQEITFPFSLVNKPSKVYPLVSPSYNEIFPGWVLSQNIYALLRNEAKYRKRNQARRQIIPWRIFRPEVVNLMQDACQVLVDIKPAHGPERIFMDKEIPGLGKNFMTEESRKQALTVYTFYCEYYALHHLWACLKEHQGVIKIERESAELLTTGLTETEAECLRRVSLSLGLDKRSIETNLTRLLELQESVIQSAIQSKERDGKRSERIMGEYGLTHELLGEDSVITSIRDETDQLKAEITAWLEKRS